jgi:2-alkenal reductase
VGFAVPINSAKRSMSQLIQSGKVRYAWLGVSTQTVTPKLAAHFQFSRARGAAVQTVVEGGPADHAGLRGGTREEDFRGIAFRPGGDLIVAIDGRPVGSAEDVVRMVTEQLVPGQTIRLTILRGEVIARDGEPVGEPRGRLVRAHHAPVAAQLGFVRELDEALAVTPQIMPVFVADE